MHQRGGERREGRGREGRVETRRQGGKPGMEVGFKLARGGRGSGLSLARSVGRSLSSVERWFLSENAGLTG